MKTYCKIFLTVALSLTVFFCFTPAQSAEIPVKNTVTLLDLGAHSCIPCKMMAPILEKLKKEYQGKAAVLFIDVWENPDQAKIYGIKTIPTQIVYDKNGKERYRHVGFWSEEEMKAKLDELLAL